MLHPIAPISLLLLVLPAPAGPVSAVQQRSVRVRERVVIRIPRMSAPGAGPVAPPAPVRWREKKGPKCVSTRSLAGALIAKRGTIDLVAVGGDRYRAELGKCPTLGFYSGFYMKRTADGMICADRDAIRSRSGRSCPIGRFRRLVPRR